MEHIRTFKMGEVLKLLKEIKALIQLSKRSYTTKIQSMGKNKAGSYRYMIYVTKAVEEQGLSKADEITFTLTKTNTINPISCAKGQEVSKPNLNKPNIEYEVKEGMKTVKLSPKSYQPPVDTSVKVDTPFEAWKAKYEEYKEKDDSRLGAHIIMGKQGELKDKIIKYLKEQTEKDLHKAMEDQQQ